MLLDGFVAHGELFGDLASAQPRCDELHHFALAIAQPIGIRACLGPLTHETIHDPLEDGRTDIPLSVDQGMHGVEQLCPAIGLQKISIHAGAQS